MDSRITRSDETIIGAVLLKDQILLTKRRDVPVWVLPGGGIENNETLEDACIREVFEETGYTVKIKRKIGEYTPINRLARFTHLYECEIIKGEATISDESKEVQFFSKTNLPSSIPPPYDEWIEDAFSKDSLLIQRDLKRVNYSSLFKNFLLHPILVIRFLLSKIGLTINT